MNASFTGQEGQTVSSGKSNSFSDCHMLLAKSMVDPITGSLTSSIMLNATLMTQIFTFNDKVKYAHMAMLEKFPGANGTGTVLVAAWQAAPAPPIEEASSEPRFAVEGLAEQHILWSLSFDMGETWVQPMVAPTHNSGPVWAPVLHFDAPTGILWMFYAESTRCVRNTVPPTWEPGGDLKAIQCQAVETQSRQANCTLNEWSTPRLVLPQSEGVDIPKVIANRLIISKRTKEWILPFWREQSIGIDSTCALNASRAAGAAAAVSSMKYETRLEPEEDMADRLPPIVPIPPPAQITSSGVAISRDNGMTWEARGTITHPHAQLIEGSVVDMNTAHVPIDQKMSYDKNAGKISLWMRSGTPCMYRADSHDGGYTWGQAFPTRIANPNSKSHVMRLEGTSEYGGGMLAIVFNNHRRALACRGCRTYLQLALSPDNGESWRVVANVETELEVGVRIHYPTMLQVGHMLYVAYSKFYIGRCTKEMLAGKFPQVSSKNGRSRKDKAIDSGLGKGLTTGLGRPSDGDGGSTTQAKPLTKPDATSKYSCLGVTSVDQGVRLVSFDLRNISKIPQLRFPSQSIKKIEPSPSALESMIEYVVQSQLKKIHASYEKSDEGDLIRRLSILPWDRVADLVLREIDLEYLGGWKFLKSRKYLLSYFRKMLYQYAPRWALTTTTSAEVEASVPTEASQSQETSLSIHPVNGDRDEFDRIEKSEIETEMDLRLEAVAATSAYVAPVPKKSDSRKSASSARGAVSKSMDVSVTTIASAGATAKDPSSPAEQIRERKGSAKKDESNRALERHLSARLDLTDTGIALEQQSGSHLDALRASVPNESTQVSVISTSQVESPESKMAASFSAFAEIADRPIGDVNKMHRISATSSKAPVPMLREEERKLSEALKSIPPLLLS